MTGIRRFDIDEPARSIIVEPRRKGFATLDNGGLLKVLYPTSRRVVAERQTELKPGTVAAISPRSDYLVAESSPGVLDSFKIHNEHPEISLATLWAKIWYEGYPEPVYSWQSSSADNDFEPKFSLTPLAFGTLKAAFYALLFAVPIAIMGAIYSAYFMAPSMRALVKPGIEIMAALPTVILGFIGGLWLAPIIEAHLSSVLTIFVVLPISLFSFALLWWYLPERISKPFSGWYGLLVIPLILGAIAAAFSLGPILEDALFGGDSRLWFRDVLGLDFDQRNALVVGLIMGLAVIPTIFSIAEDAIYGVPRHLSNGSLALGATPWQTLVRVVLLTASPGIFSAVMIGMGRAVGETMIVLMATGNTPLMNFNIFEGMRTFAANIAVELPESEVGSSHYRILFLAALVLFMITFAFNTVAEIVRQRLPRALREPVMLTNTDNDSKNSLGNWWTSGEPWIWLNAAAVGISITAVVGLLLLIAVKGFAHFWPADITQINYTQLTAQGPLSRVVYGEIVEQDSLPVQQYLESGGDSTVLTGNQEQVTRWLIKTGNRRINPPDFRWVVENQIQERTTPEGLAVIERLEWGNA